MHYHIRTDAMTGLGTFATAEEAAREAAYFNTHHDGYTAHQMKGGARAEECACWMGAYVLTNREHSQAA